MEDKDKQVPKQAPSSESEIHAPSAVDEVPPVVNHYAINISDILQGVKADVSSSPKRTINNRLSSSTTFQSLIDEQTLRKQEITNDKFQIANDKLLAKNEILKKNQKLKTITLVLLFLLLFAESAVLFVLTFFQGFHFYGFDLDPVTLRIIVTASLIQISAMLTIAVRHLFPAVKNKKD